jgi:hypothetical protein
MSTYKLGLCNGRHQLPEVDGYVYGTEVNPMDFTEMELTANESIPADADHIDLYVTGLTAATLAVVKVCECRAINLTCWHYDREQGNYQPQQIFRGFRPCPFCGYRHLGDWCPNCGAN